MSRQKGPGAIKHIDVAKHGDVDMRDMLWRNDSAPTENEAKLERLCTARESLMVELSNLRTLENDLIAAVNVEGDITLARAKSERQLRKISVEIQRVEKKFGIITKHIEETLNEVKKEAAADCAPAVLAWQEAAVFLMTAHKLLDTRAGDNTCSPGRSKITTRELLTLLRKAGFEIGGRDEESQLRQLQRFMRECGVEGQQGRRTDLRAK